jgi:hypothetical protein
MEVELLLIKEGSATHEAAPLLCPGELVETGRQEVSFPRSCLKTHLDQENRASR